MSIRTRLLIILVPGLAIILVAGGLWIYWSGRGAMLHQMDEHLAARARAVAALVAWEPPRLAFDPSDADPAVLSPGYEIRTEGGEVLKRSGVMTAWDASVERLLEGEVLIRNVALPQGRAGRAAWFMFRPAVDREDWRGEGAPPEAPERLIAATVLDRQPLDRALAALAGTLLVVFGAAGAGAVLLVGMGVAWGLAPLSRLRKRLKTISAERLGVRLVQPGAPRELRPVYAELDRLLHRMERTLERERAFADAAAHELRTPLSELRAGAEVALRWPDHDRTHRALQEAMAIGAEMERIVESLLLISRGRTAEAGGIDAPPAAIDDIVRERLRERAGEIARRRLDIDNDLEATAVFPAPREAMEVLLRNLLDNAIQYTADGGQVRIRLEGAAVSAPNGATKARGHSSSNGGASLLIENGPVDLREEELARLFEPFWQRNPSRSDRGHVGLGLSVVARCAQAVGLRISTRLAEKRLEVKIEPGTPSAEAPAGP